MAEPQVWADGTAGTVIGAAVWNGRTVLATDWSGGRLHAFGIENGGLEPWGDGYHHPEGIAARGDEALIVEQGGVLLRQNLLDPGRAGAVEVATGLGAPHGVVWSEDGASAQLSDRTGRLLSVDLATGAVEIVAGGLAAPVGLAVGASGEAYLTEQGTGALTRIDPDGTRTTVLTGLVGPFLLAWADDARTQLLVTERAPAHRVGLVDLTVPAPNVQRLVGRGITQPSQAIICRDRLVVTGQNRLLSLDAAAGLEPGVRLVIPGQPLWPGAWVDATIDTGVTGYTRADLDIVVDPPGLVTLSPHPAADLDPTRPTIRLLAGAETGSTRLVARETGSGAELGVADVLVDFAPVPPLDGPPQWIDNPTEPPLPMTLLSAVPGVADAGSLVPRDAAGNKLASWRVVAVLVDTDDAKWPTTVTPTEPAPTVATAQASWRTVFTGASGVDAFYREMSGGRLGLTLVTGGVLGPVHLGGKWADWHQMNGTLWEIKDDMLQRIATALQGTPGLTWTDVDAIFVIVRSASSTNFTWPFAKSRQVTIKVKSGGKDVDHKVARVCMPHDQTTTVKFTDVAVSAHELGHTFGLDDQYMPATDPNFTDAMRTRELGQRELMAHEDNLPHLAARHKLLLGFLDPGQVRTFTLGVPESNQIVDLVPVSSGLPPAGRMSAIELRVAPGLSWFFELRQPVPGLLGDLHVPTFGTGQVIGYDAIKYRNPPVVADKRKPIIMLIDDGDGEGAALTASQDYESLEELSPNQFQQFRLEVISIAAGGARVRVDVGKGNRPDPVLLNNNGEKGDYKSPDIEVRNALSDADKKFLNKPVVGIVNRVVAFVHNEGGLNAPTVSVRFKALPMSTDDAESTRWTELPGPTGTPAVTHDVDAGARVEFEVQWVPTDQRHHCVQARIDRYVRIPGGVDEPDVDNNLAQSNYFDLISQPKSPATRELSVVDVHNPFPYPADAWIELVQDSTRYRSYVDHRWLHLQPGETRSVRVEVESKATSIWDAIEAHWPDGRTWLRSWLPGAGCTAKTGSGVTLGVSTKVESQLRLVEFGPGLLQLRVDGPPGAPSPSEGSVVALVEYEDGTIETLAADLDGFGNAQLRPQPIPGIARVWYSGAPAYAPVDSWEVEVRG